MVFRRRDKRNWATYLRELLWPKGGWGRAARYVKHRLHRLPDQPHRISRGIFAGVFVTFTPLYGLHFLISAFLARVMGGNILAALLATFFGNPLTYVPIGIVSLQTGYFILGIDREAQLDGNIVSKFGGATRDLLWNLWAYVTGMPRDWGQLSLFWDDVFYPYLIGGLLPGLIAGLIAYYLSLPVITAYQNRRKGRIKERFAAIKNKVRQKQSQEGEGDV